MTKTTLDEQYMLLRQQKCTACPGVAWWPEECVPAYVEFFQSLEKGHCLHVILPLPLAVL